MWKQEKKNANYNLCYINKIEINNTELITSINYYIFFRTIKHLFVIIRLAGLSLKFPLILTLIVAINSTVLKSLLGRILYWYRARPDPIMGLWDAGCHPVRPADVAGPDTSAASLTGLHMGWRHVEDRGAQSATWDGWRGRRPKTEIRRIFGILLPMREHVRSRQRARACSK